jgi:hypothetical protein
MITLVLYIGSLPILTTWLLLCGNNPVVKNDIYSNSDLNLWPNDPKINRVLMWSSLVKIQYTELKLPCGNDPVVKKSIYSNSDLDLWTNDPKINRILPLPQGNHVVKIGKDPIYRTKVISSKVKVTVTINRFFDNRVISAW